MLHAILRLHALSPRQLDEMADEEVYRLRQAMDQAAMIDREAVHDGRPAIEKLKLLPEVVAVLQK